MFWKNLKTFFLLKIVIDCRDVDRWSVVKIGVLSFQNIASAGNRTRVYRVAGDNSTTEPPMLLIGFFQWWLYCYNNFWIRDLHYLVVWNKKTKCIENIKVLVQKAWTCQNVTNVTQPVHARHLGNSVSKKRKFTIRFERILGKNEGVFQSMRLKWKEDTVVLPFFCGSTKWKLWLWTTFLKFMFATIVVFLFQPVSVGSASERSPLESLQSFSVSSMNIPKQLQFTSSVMRKHYAQTFMDENTDSNMPPELKDKNRSMSYTCLSSEQDNPGWFYQYENKDKYHRNVSCCNLIAMIFLLAP